MTLWEGPRALPMALWEGPRALPMTLWEKPMRSQGPSGRSLCAPSDLLDQKNNETVGKHSRTQKNPEEPGKTLKNPKEP